MTTATSAEPRSAVSFFGAHAGSPGAVVLFLVFATSGIVWIEPAPFDVLLLMVLAGALINRLHVPRTLAPLIIAFALLSVTGLLAAVLSDLVFDSARHILISIFLYVIAFGLTLMIARAPDQVLPPMMNGVVLAGLIATCAGIVGYFSPGDWTHEIFTERDRARGTFKDPNVFGPFVVFGLAYLFARFMRDEDRVLSVPTAVAAVLGFGLLLSFSRGAWANGAISLAIVAYLLFVSSRKTGTRLRIALMSWTLLGGAAAALLFALQFDAIAEMMSIRGQLVQSYDVDQRFVG
ncbi:MAG: hypothetical protein AAGJ70_08130, partial [Pseudomonadota bacterium]